MNGKQLRRSLLPALILLVMCSMLLLTACEKEKMQVQEPNPEKGVYYIYYKNTEGTELIASTYETETKSGDRETLVKELLTALQSQKMDDPSVLPAVPSNLQVDSFDISLLPYLTVNFTKSYSEQNSADEILCRAALVMTLTQIPQVQYIEIQVAGQPLMDRAQNSVGKLSAEKFMTTINGNMFSRQKNTLLLYFASEDGNELVEVERTVLNDSSMAMEKLVVKLLIEGPPDNGTRAVLPDTVSILDISIRSGTCYVNFDSSFLTETMDLSPEIVIYSIVNSLTELNDINQVQFMVNGSSNVNFMDSISLAEPFTKNLNYLFVQEEETEKGDY